MIMRFLVGIILGAVSVSCAGQVAPAAGTTHPPLSGSIGFGMDYMSGDWGAGKINRWGPTGFVSTTLWHDISVIAEGRSVIWGGNRSSQGFKYVEGGGGLVWVSDYFGRFQPLFKGEIGFGSLTHPDNFTGHFHDTRTTYTVGGGVEYHTAGRFWTRVEYDYDFFPEFHSSISGLNHALNIRGFTFGETYRFGRGGSRY